MKPTVPHPNPKAEAERKAARAASRRIARAYASVFGLEAERNEDQRIVLDDMADACAQNKSTVRVNQFGAVDSGAMLMIEGSRQVYLRIQNKLKEAIMPPELEEQP